MEKAKIAEPTSLNVWLQAACFLIAVSLAFVWYSSRAEHPASATRAPTVNASVELVLVDDAVDPLATVPDSGLPAGVALLRDYVGVAQASRHYARLVLRRGESFEQARSRLEPWLTTVQVPEGGRWAWQHRDTGEYRSLLLNGPPVFTAVDLASAKVTLGSDNLCSVGVKLHAEASERFRQFTAEHVRQRMALVVNQRVITAPFIETELAGGMFQVTPGGRDPEETRIAAEAMVKQLTGAADR